ncbi:MAG TPA: hypothetical protein VFG05_06945 [Methylocella sp.]|nr:hypothetical protein [Methylocella sp.]
MTMPEGNEEDRRAELRRLQALICGLDNCPDPVARETARELLALVLDLHGIGLAKLMEIVTASDKSGTIRARLVENKQVEALLLLHGLHPEDLPARVRRAAARLHPHLGVLGLSLDAVDIAGGAVTLRVRHGAKAALQAPLMWSLRCEIEDAIVEAAPDIEKITIEGLDLPEAAAVRAAE